MEIYKSKLSKEYENPIGLEFYSFYLEESNKGTKFNKDTGIFKVKPIEGWFNKVFMVYKYEVIEVFKKPKLGGYSIEYFINSFHDRSANLLYDSYDDAVKAYDKRILKVLENPHCSEYEIKLLEKILINKQTQIQMATNWYNSLEDLHKKYLEFLGFKI
jgi:hypothetical protein